MIPYVIEINSTDLGFQPSYAQWRDISVKRQREGWKFLLNRMDGSSLHGQVKDQNGKALATASLHIVGSFTQDYTVNADGYFDVIVNPGKYTVTVSAPGIQSMTKTVTVGNKRVEL